MFSIGEFSKIVCASVKTLRYYDQIGLVRPERIGENGYRYYSLAQAERVRLILKLRRYEFSLKEIQEMLDTPESFLKNLEAQRDKLFDERRALSAVLSEMQAHIQNYRRTHDMTDYQKNYTIALKDTPALPVISWRGKFGVKDFGAAFSKLYERVAKKHADVKRTSGAVYYDPEFSDECSDIEVFVIAKNPEQADHVLPAGPTAHTVHHGAYSGLGDAYTALTAWIEKNGCAVAGAPYEIYRVNQFDTLDPDAWETDIYFPVVKK